MPTRARLHNYSETEKEKEGLCLYGGEKNAYKYVVDLTRNVLPFLYPTPKINPPKTDVKYLSHIYFINAPKWILQ